MAQAASRAVRGHYFEEFEVGYTIVSPARTITEHDVCAFAGLSGDFNPLHTDAEYARDTPFGERIAHGVLGLAVATGLASRLGFLDGTTLAFLGLDWKFRKPILLDDTIHVVVAVTEKREQAMMGGGIVTFDVRVVNHRDDVVQKGLWRILIRARPQDEGAPAVATLSGAGSTEGAGAGDGAG